MHYYVSHGNHDIVDEAEWQQTWKTPMEFTFEKYQVAFIVLNTSDEKGNYICPDIE